MAKTLPPPWSKECSRHRLAESAMKIVGAADGELLHHAAEPASLVRFELRGDHADAYWMVNGQLVARTGAGQSYTYRFGLPGRYEVTAFDNTGVFDRIGVSVR